MRAHRLPRFARVLLGTFGVLVALTAFIGFAHTRPGRPLLAWLGKTTGFGAKRGGGCPLGYDQTATPEQREAARARFAVVHGGSERAASKPALGFALDRTTRGDVLAWAAAHGLSCGAGKGVADLRCADVPDDLVPDSFRGAGGESVWFTFGTGDRLVSVIAIAHAEAPDPIRAAFVSIKEALDRETGSTAKVDGSPESLASGALYQATAEYRFRDYYAVARATNVGNGSYALTEEYRSLPN